MVERCEVGVQGTVDGANLPQRHAHVGVRARTLGIVPLHGQGVAVPAGTATVSETVTVTGHERVCVN